MVDVSAETLSKNHPRRLAARSSASIWNAPWRLATNWGGILVSGHVDAVTEVLRPSSQRATPNASASPCRADLAHFIAPKGSVTLDGVSLTVNEVGETSFGVNIIPHTAEVTSFGDLKKGDRVNLEIDLLARYLERLLTKKA